MRRLAGALMLVLAALLLGWIGYNLLVERVPAAQGRPVLPALAFAAGLVYVGLSWVRDRTAR